MTPKTPKPTLMMWIRSIVFTICFYLSTLFFFTIMIPTVFMPYKYSMMFLSAWTKWTRLLLAFFCKIHIRVEGMENLPHTNGYIVASKHQSAMETALFHSLLPRVFYVLKRTLLWVPLAGLYVWKTGCVAIDRSGGTRTMRTMLSSVQKNLKRHRNLVIFPEGTRTIPGVRKPYSPGVAFLYEQCQVPVVPVALNTGYVWPKNKTLKYPGTVTVRILPAIQPGLHKRAFLNELEDRIEEAQTDLPHPFEVA